MEKGKNHPTLPPNYVTLAQLQERWLNEQQRKQREKQEEERKQREKEEERERKRKQGEKNEQERKRREKKNQRRNENGGKRRTNSVSVSSQRQFQGNFQSQPEKSRRTVEVRETRMEESKIGGVNCQEQNGGKSMVKKKNNVTMWEMKRRSRAQEDLAPSTAQLPPENEAEKSEIGGVNCQEQNGGKSMKKEKNSWKKWKKKSRSRAQQDLAPSTAQLPPENEAEEKVSVVVTETNGEEEKTGSEIRPNGKNLPVYRKVSENEPEEEIPVVVTEINGEKEKRGSEFWPNVPVYDVKVSEKETEEEIPVVLAERNGEKDGVRSNFWSNRKGLRVYGKVWEQKGLLDGSAEIRLNFNNLSLNGGKESNQRLTAEMNGGNRNYYRGFEGFNSRNTRKPIDASLVWVRKGETSDADAAKTQSSGSLVKGWKGKNPIQ